MKNPELAGGGVERGLVKGKHNGSSDRSACPCLKSLQTSLRINLMSTEEKAQGKEMSEHTRLF